MVMAGYPLLVILALLFCTNLLGAVLGVACLVCKAMAAGAAFIDGTTSQPDLTGESGNERKEISKSV